MKMLKITIVLLSLALACAPAMAAKGGGKKPPNNNNNNNNNPTNTNTTTPPDHTPLSITVPTPYSFVKYAQGTLYERPQWSVTVASVQDGAVITLLYPGKDANTDPNALNLIKDLKPGNIVNITAHEIDNKPTLISIAAYKPQPGEEEAGVFVFRKTVDSVSGIKGEDSIEVSKMGKVATLTMQTIKDPLNGTVPDPAIAKVIEKAKHGDLLILDVRMAGQTPVLQSALAYTPMSRAQFTAVNRKSGDGKDLEFATVELKTDTGIEAVKIANKEVKTPDPALMTAVNSFKMGQVVYYRLKTDDAGVKWLYQIQVTAPEKVAEKTTTSSPAVTKADK